MQPGLGGDTLDVNHGDDLGAYPGWDDDYYGDNWNGTTPAGIVASAAIPLRGLDILPAA